MLTPFGDLVLVEITDRDAMRPPSSRILLREDDYKWGAAWGVLRAVGRGRMALRGGAVVPSVSSLGWELGDRVLFLQRFRAFDAAHAGYPAGTMLISDYDILASDRGLGLLQPNYGRVIISPEPPPSEELSVGGLVIVTAQERSQAPKIYGAGNVVSTAPETMESVGKNPDKPADGWSTRRTLEYNGLRTDLGFGPGDRVIYARGHAWSFVCGGVGGAEFHVVNTRDVVARVTEEVKVG